MGQYLYDDYEEFVHTKKATCIFICLGVIYIKMGKGRSIVILTELTNIKAERGFLLKLIGDN